MVVVLVTLVPTSNKQGGTQYIHVHLDVIDNSILDLIGCEEYRPLVHEYAETITRVGVSLQQFYHHYVHKPYIRHTQTLKTYSGVAILPSDPYPGLLSIPASSMYFSAVMEFIFLPVWSSDWQNHS
jgi:hypothetical protein